MDSLSFAGQVGHGNRAVENTLLRQLSMADRALLDPHLERLSLVGNQYLIDAGERFTYVWFPHDAVASVVVTTEEGAMTEAGLIGSDGFVGIPLLLGSLESNVRVMIQIPGGASRMRTTPFITYVMSRGGKFYDRLLRYTNGFIGMIAQTAACNNEHSIEQRMARWLLMVRDRVGRDGFALTQEFLALMLGSGRQSVSVIAAQMERDGILAHRQGFVEILDPRRLERVACSCYSSVQQLMSVATL